MRYFHFLIACGLLLLVSCSDDSPPNDPEVPGRGYASQSDAAGDTTDSARGDDSSRNVPDSSTKTSALPAPPQLLTEKQIADGWVSLFDGKTLYGWRANDDPDAGGANWNVDDGVITADKSDAPSLLLSAVQFSDFELQLDYRLAEGGNSGVFLRTISNPQDPATECYELNMCNTHPAFGTGSLVGRQKAEFDEAAGNPMPAEGEWHTIRVRAEGNQIVAHFDDRLVIDFVDESAGSRRIGYIGLQQNQGKIEFRNVALRPLGTVPLFDGESLAGWRTVPGSKSEFEVTEGMIELTNGPGFLETEQTWADFVLQFDVRTNAKDVNSGVFFRAEKGTEENPSNGYELQICNSFADGDRSRPNDYKSGYGTGAIMHRSAARYIIADDNQWTTMTLVADGPRFATWVNGYLTTVWTDDRQPDDNPRNGLRSKAGHLSLQGHDDKTKASFRHLRVLATDEKPVAAE